jgi:putative photosynthetic complex assembly protein
MSETAQVGKGGQHAENIPRGVLIAAGVLIVFALAVTFYGRTTDVGVVHMPAMQAYQTVRLHFVEQDDGGIAINDASDGAALAQIAPGANGFLRSMMRGLVRARNRNNIGPEAPFTLTRWANGTMSLTDETTGRRIDLDAFGATQAETFAKIFPARKATTP